MRCRTPLREQLVMESPVAEASRSWSWIWVVLAVIFAGSMLRTCATQRSDAAAALVVPVVTYREQFLTEFNKGCLQKGSSRRFCDCAGPRVLETFKQEELDDVVESTRNGRPDVRMSTIMLQCSR